MKKAWFLLVAGALGALSCGGDDTNEAEAKCQDLVKTFCSRVVSCAASDAELSATYTQAELTDECENVTNKGAHCGDAVRVTDNYAACLDQASNLECSASNAELRDANLPIPQICASVILYN